MERLGPIHAQASDLQTEPGVLRMLARHRDARVRVRVATNPITPVEGLLWLLEEFTAEVMANGAMTLGLLANPGLIGQAPVRLRGCWAVSGRVPVWVLVQLASDDNPHLRRMLAGNPRTPIELLERLCSDPEPWVRSGAAENPRLPLEVIERLARDPRSDRRALVGGNPATPPALLAALADDDEPRVQLSTVRNPSLPPERLDRLVSHSLSWVRGEVARRSTLPAVLAQLAADEEASVRHQATQRLAALGG